MADYEIFDPWSPFLEKKIGVVVHGPEIIDSGGALSLINYLKKRASVAAVLGGTMGRVVVIDGA
jgi:hypothetical protein